MKAETLTDILFDEMEKLRNAKTSEEILRESQRASSICNVASKLIDYGNMQIAAFDAIGEKACKDSIKKICKND